MLPLPLSATEIRVLGSLVEKEITTPEYYPLTLNALVNACNQKSNRDPVVSYEEATVRDGAEALKRKGLAVTASGAGHRVEKYGHRLWEALNPGRRELALLCVLMLRGPQTLGELRDRTARMHHFEDLQEVERVIENLIAFSPQPLALKLGRQPGMKEPRYAHLLAGEPELEPEERIERTPLATSPIEEELRALKSRVEELETQFAAFRRQFE